MITEQQVVAHESVGQLILPPNFIEINGPLVFLAGPIQGTGQGWQQEAIKYLQELQPRLHIASPRRSVAPEDFIYNEQVDWETHFLRRAGAQGAVMFWLASEVEHRCDRAYAQTTRFELAEWKVRHERDGVNLVIGIEEGFTNARYIRRRFSQDCPEITICNSLAETCRQVIKVIYKNI